MYSVGGPLCESAGLQQMKDCPCLLMNDKSLEVEKKKKRQCPLHNSYKIIKYLRPMDAWGLRLILVTHKIISGDFLERIAI